MRDKLRKIQDSSKLEIKNLEKQRSELLQAFKKQSLLVDNLKKQIVRTKSLFLYLQIANLNKIKKSKFQSYLEAAKQVQLTETEFMKLLDWKPEET